MTIILLYQELLYDFMMMVWLMNYYLMSQMKRHAGFD